MSPPVFISYARSSSTAQAEALRKELGEDRCFLDTADIEPGKPFPKHIVDALLAARVVVIFADAMYFRRWYCLWELRTTLSPYLALGPQASEEARRDVLSPIVVAVPKRFGQPFRCAAS